MLKENSSKNIMIRVRESDKNKIKEAAERAGLNLSEYILLAVSEKMEREEQ